MIIPLDKLLSFSENRYVYTRAAMIMVDKLGNIREYPEGDDNWKVVPNILRLMMEGRLNYKFDTMK